jgi:hypothetical protein
VRNPSLPFFLIFSVPCACRRSPAAGDPPPRGVSRHGRRSRLLDHLVMFPVTQLRVGPNHVPIRGP